MNEPMVRLGMSLIPAGDNADAFKSLLRSCYEAGFSCGFDTAIIFLEKMMEANKKKDK